MLLFFWWNSGNIERKLDMICAKGTEIHLIIRQTPFLVDFLYLQEYYKSFFFQSPKACKKFRNNSGRSL